MANRLEGKGRAGPRPAVLLLCVFFYFRPRTPANTLETEF